MKRLLYLVALFGGISTHAQIANADFESWYADSTGKSRLTGWEHLVKYDFPGGMFGTWKETPAEHGQYALKLSRWYSYTWDVLRQKSPLSFKPSGLSGYYKYTDNNLSNGRTKDTALLEMYITRWNSALNMRDTIGTGTKELSLSAAFTPFSCPVNYTTSGLPDSILIRFQPTKFGVSGVGACADSNYCSFLTIDNLSLEQNTGVQLHHGDLVSVYPNPAHDMLAVDLERVEPCIVTLTDISGHLVLRELVNAGRIRLDISRISPGLYFLRLRGSDYRIVTRVQKQ